ncbi:Prefoldin subunit 5 [Amphibalanus amphitrite]|uniref:Prefoldin subunit 5 n=1 Tax=Amphibalanus amphitrite TaxID=1232801 RepID=A0A6A4UUG6_AMPAM|nr:prefoldin subunit 5-like [Amphibalanus amphitrite]XP_043238804.1 prefoldin subunit 5-like [Amphibalanus amphitrite]XP_043238805.1 prefoldin subunit 5-like [Amphibalanus amphitrite]KAF0287357.1 Prefoldin subunit 5 [Amphibalanus amphitrite]KAF0287670.1 Prefoldin subunit 5 [Amphibalanus amphitrite]
MDSQEAGKMQTIEIDKLNIQQLSQMKQQLDQEVGLFNDSLQQLKMAQQKFSESLESVQQLTPDAAGKEILVPLTASMYVPGRLVDPEHVLVDVGTGYYLEKTTEGAREYFKRRIKFVTEQMEKLQKIGAEKQRVRDALDETLQGKVQMAAQQQAAQKAAA